MTANHWTLRHIIDSKPFQWGTFAAIVANAIAVVFESFSGNSGGDLSEFLDSLDEIFVAIFTVEILLKIIAYRKDYVKDPWNVFDVLVTCPAWIPAINALSVARVARVIRLLRLLSIFPSFRSLTSAMMRSLVDTLGIAGLVMLFMFITGVLAHRLFGEVAPALFGNLGVTLFTMFKIVALFDLMSTLNALDSVSHIAYPFFLIYFVAMSYFVLNFLIAIASYNIYNVMNELYASRSEKKQDDAKDQMAQELSEIKATLAALLQKQNERSSVE